MRRKAHKRSRSLGEPVDAEELKTNRTRELEVSLFLQALASVSW